MKFIILILSIFSISCSSILNSNSIKVDASSDIDETKIKIEHGISATTINRNNDQFLFDNRSGYKIVYESGKSKQIVNEYGENDFLITYKDSFYFEFRQFKTNWRNQHTYKFGISLENGLPMIDVNIIGRNELNFKAQMIPISDAYKHYGNELCVNYYLNTKDCFENIAKFRSESNDFETTMVKYLGVKVRIQNLY